MQAQRSESYTSVLLINRKIQMKGWSKISSTCCKLQPILHRDGQIALFVYHIAYNCKCIFQDYDQLLLICSQALKLTYL